MHMEGPRPRTTQNRPAPACIPARAAAPRGLFILLVGSVCLACGGLAADGPLAVSSEALTNLDRTLERLLGDLLQQPEPDRRFQRYVLIAAHEGGETFPGAAPRTEAERRARIERVAEGERTAVSKLVNSLTMAPDIHRPEPIDEARSIVRIDLRDYGWEGPTDVAGSRHADRWEAIAANAALCVPLEGPHAEKLEQLTGSTAPFLLARDLVATAANGELYYALLGLPTSIDELQAQLMRGTLAGATNRVTESQKYRAGFTTSGISPVIRAVERGVDAVEPGRGYWQAFDFGDDERGSAVFSDPLSFTADATEVIFSLPNGLQAFFVANGDGQRVTDYPPASVTTHASRDHLYENGASCFGCHSVGALGFSDQVRSRYLIQEAGVAPNVRAQILATYPEVAVMDQLMAGANQAYVEAAQRAGLLPDEQDQISTIASEPRTAAPHLDLAASQLFVTPDELTSAPGVEVTPGFDHPATGFLDLQSGTYREAYPGLLCQLHRAGLNKPVGCR